MNPQAPSLQRTLTLPLQPASLLLIVPVALLLEFFGAFRPQVSLPAWLGTYVLCIWMNRYAFAVLDTAANGGREAPVASVEMLGPFSDARSWVLPVVVSLCVLGLLWLPASLRPSVALLMAVLLPLPVAATELTDRLGDMLNPLAWWRVLHGLGVIYLLLLSGIAACSALTWLAWMIPMPRMLQLAVTLLMYLMCFALLGGLLFQRRNALQFSPRNSPERIQERLDGEHAQALQAMIDDAYKSTRARRTQDLATTLDRWFAQTPATLRRADITALLEATHHWSDATGRTLLHRVLIERLTALPDMPLALQLAAQALQAQPDFAPRTADLTATLVRHAQQTGQRHLATRLLDNALQRCAEEDRPALLALQQ